MPIRPDTETNHVQKSIALDELRLLYQEKASGLTSRAAKVLENWQSRFPNDRAFFETFIEADRRDISALPGCNLFTRVEILAFRKNLLNGAVLAPEAVSEPTPEPQIVEQIPVEEVDYVEAAQYELEEEPEINTPEPESSEELFEPKEESKPSLPPFPFVEPSEYDRLSSLQETLGHFPLFAWIDTIIENLAPAAKTIAREGVRFYDGEDISDLELLQERLGMSYGVMRQRRQVLLTSLEAHFSVLHGVGYMTENPYNFQMNHVEREINASEGTNFSLPFVYWVLSRTFPELSLLGDPAKCFLAKNKSGQTLYLVPTALLDIFDFQGFIDSINAQLKVRRINEESISLRSLMEEHFKVRYYEEELPEVERTCRTFLYINFPVEVDYGNVIFPSNKKKTNTQIVEEILRAAHRPMTLSEILDEFLYEYPERDVNEERIRGAIYPSDKIIATMPPGSFAWNDGSYEEFKGGSVITYINDYLQSLPEKIATSAAVADYVMGFIPDTNEDKVVNRLFSDQAKDIVTYYREGVRYIGYIDGDYPDDFFSYPSDYRIALNYSTMFPAFIQFVQEYHRFPFSSGVADEERKLRNFWIRTELDYERGLLSERVSRYFKKVQDEYSRYKMDKPEYLWRVQYAHLAHEVGLDLDEEEAFLLRFEPEKDHTSWLNHILTDYKYRIERIPGWKIERIEKIIHGLQSTDTLYSELLTKLNLNV